MLFDNITYCVVSYLTLSLNKLIINLLYNIVMTSHILFSEGLQDQNKLTFKVSPISKDWHLTCNNFKGTEKECTEEGERQRSKAADRFNRRNSISQPHYLNAAEGSIHDY